MNTGRRFTKSVTSRCSSHQKEPVAHGFELAIGLFLAGAASFPATR